MVIYLILSLLFIVADQVMKMWIVSNFALHTGQELLPGIVKLFYIQNTGAAWGILAGQQFVFYIITIFGVSAILYLMFQEKGKSKFALTTYSLLLAGALGNFIDRVRLGYVVDMFQFEFIDFPIFNIADICLTVGVAALFLYILIVERKKEKVENKIIELTLSLEKSERLDKILTQELSHTRSVIQQWLKSEFVSLNGEIVKANYKAKDGDNVTIQIEEEEELTVLAENIPLEIVYEDEHLLVINKPSGMVVHPSKGHSTGTLVNALLYHVDQLSKGSESYRPGIVHRIDKDTSGLLVVAKTPQAHVGLSNQLMDHSMTRSYVAIVEGSFEHITGTVDAPLARDPHNRLKRCVQKEGKEAITHFTVIQPLKEASVLRLNLETGRTHQIRAHMEFINHPILNDPMYHPNGKNATEFGQYLHAETLGFVHPITQEKLYFESPLPKEFEEKIQELQ